MKEEFFKLFNDVYGDYTLNGFYLPKASVNVIITAYYDEYAVYSRSSRIYYNTVSAVFFYGDVNNCFHLTGEAEIVAYEHAIGVLTAIKEMYEE